MNYKTQLAHRLIWAINEICDYPEMDDMTERMKTKLHLMFHDIEPDENGIKRLDDIFYCQSGLMWTNDAVIYNSRIIQNPVKFIMPGFKYGFDQNIDKKISEEQEQKATEQTEKNIKQALRYYLPKGMLQQYYHHAGCKINCDPKLKLSTILKKCETFAEAIHSGTDIEQFDIEPFQPYMPSNYNIFTLLASAQYIAEYFSDAEKHNIIYLSEECLADIDKIITASRENHLDENTIKVHLGQLLNCGRHAFKETMSVVSNINLYEMMYGSKIYELPLRFAKLYKELMTLPESSYKNMLYKAKILDKNYEPDETLLEEYCKVLFKRKSHVSGRIIITIKDSSHTSLNDIKITGWESIRLYENKNLYNLNNDIEMFVPGNAEICGNAISWRYVIEQRKLYTKFEKAELSYDINSRQIKTDISAKFIYDMLGETKTIELI